MVTHLRQIDYEASIAIPNYMGPRLNIGGQKSSKVTMVNSQTGFSFKSKLHVGCTCNLKFLKHR